MLKRAMMMHLLNLLLYLESNNYCSIFLLFIVIGKGCNFFIATTCNSSEPRMSGKLGLNIYLIF